MAPPILVSFDFGALNMACASTGPQNRRRERLPLVDSGNVNSCGRESKPAMLDYQPERNC